MRIREIIVIVIVLLLSIGVAEAKEIEKTTYLYAVKNQDSLWLDKYQTITTICGENKSKEEEKQIKTKPCVIFMFGGGFASGSRDREDYLPYLNYLAEEGYVVVSIDYRLGFKNFGLSGDQQPMDFVKAFVGSIQMAVDDLFSATALVVKKAEEWGIDPKAIIANGSSAGAIAVLQGAYEISHQTLITKQLPKGFNYAGVISFAGAILTVGEFEFAGTPPPIMLFHGDADKNVPYGAIEESGAGFYGSQAIANVLEKSDAPYWFWSMSNATHQLAVTPMNNNRDEIMAFLNGYVKQKRQLKINSAVDEIGGKERDKKFSIEDYVKANFPQ